MTVLELAEYVGITATYHGVPGLVIEVQVSDARMSWGQVQLQIQPTRPQDNSGSKWVNSDSVIS